MDEEDPDREMQMAIQASLDADAAGRRAKNAVDAAKLVGPAAAVAGAVHVAMEQEDRTRQRRPRPMIAL